MKINVRVKPKSKIASIKPNLFGNLVVAVHEPATEGKANVAVIAALAAYYGVSKSAVTILRGHTSKQKTVQVLF
ncbi:DUF167 domain-containing protein [Candidatus Berkelbacteria bacterium]|nr:DUF167 domain-containing protein [Candidatus Berkelbacteria bacterium]